MVPHRLNRWTDLPETLPPDAHPGDGQSLLYGRSLADGPFGGNWTNAFFARTYPSEREGNVFQPNGFNMLGTHHLTVRFRPHRSFAQVRSRENSSAVLTLKSVDCVPTYVRHSQTDDVSTGLMLNARSRQRWQGFLRVSCLPHLWLPNGVAFCEIL